MILQERKNWIKYVILANPMECFNHNKAKHVDHRRYNHWAKISKGREIKKNTLVNHMSKNRRKKMLLFTCCCISDMKHFSPCKKLEILRSDVFSSQSGLPLLYTALTQTVGTLHPGCVIVAAITPWELNGGRFLHLAAECCVTQIDPTKTSPLASLIPPI